MCVPTNYKITGFKFQSDSINTVNENTFVGGRINFKFQSDSINTYISMKK